MYAYRPVRPDDLRLVARHRHEMFMASGRADVALAPMTAAFETWLAPRLADGSYFGWIVEDADAEPVGGLGMMVVDWPPHPSHPTQARRGYILNVFVEPAHRGRGLSQALLDRAMAEARRLGLDHMFLHATEMGRPVYAKNGWRPTSEMSISLREA